MYISSDSLYLDGGVLANLCVADSVAQILAAVPYRPVLLSDMLNRSYPISNAAPADVEPGANTGNGEIEIEGADVRHVAVRTLVDRGVFHMCPAWDSEHVRLVVELSDRLSDRTAHLAAWALLCGGAIGSDDRRTKWLIAEYFPGIQLVTTARLIHLWQQTTGLSDEDARRVIRQIRQRAFFVPPESDPLHDWWLSHSGDE